MYTRNIRIKLRANSATEFRLLLKERIMPLLRTQKAFRIRSHSSLPSGTRQLPLVSGTTKRMRLLTITWPISTSCELCRL